jgi:hypothetical protein
MCAEFSVTHGVFRGARKEGARELRPREEPNHKYTESLEG